MTNTLFHIVVGVVALAAATTQAVSPVVDALAGLPPGSVYLAACAIIGFFGGLTKEFQEHDGKFEKHQVVSAIGAAFSGLMAGLAASALELPPVAMLLASGWAGLKGPAILDSIFGPIAARFGTGTGGKVAALLPHAKKHAATLVQVTPQKSAPAEGETKPFDGLLLNP